MKVRDLLRRMEGDGWYLARQPSPAEASGRAADGDAAWASGEDLNPNTLQSILKQAGYKA